MQTFMRSVNALKQALAKKCAKLRKGAPTAKQFKAAAKTAKKPAKKRK